MLLSRQERSPLTDFTWYAPGPGVPVLLLMSDRLAPGNPATGAVCAVDSACGPTDDCTHSNDIVRLNLRQWSVQCLLSWEKLMMLAEGGTGGV